MTFDGSYTPMPNPIEVTKALGNSLEKHAGHHIRQSVRSARDAYDLDEFAGAKTFGMALHDILRNRFLQALVHSEDTPFESLRTESGYEVPILDHAKYGRIVVYHHRVDTPDYLPRSDSAQMLQDHATQRRDLFGNETRPLRHRLLGVVGGPIGGLEEAVVGKIVPAVPGSSHRRVAHVQKLDLNSGSGGHGGDSGGPSVNPEPDVEPEVTLGKEEAEEGAPA